MTSELRDRLAYVGLALSTIGLGLGVHVGGGGLAPVARDFFGDALWAAMLVWWVSAVSPSRALWLRASVALAASFVVEVSQLIHTAALDGIRRTRLGHLVLGSGFEPRDFFAYTCGSSRWYCSS